MEDSCQSRSILTDESQRSNASLIELKLEGSPFLLAHVLSSVGHLLNFLGQFFMNRVCGGLGFGGDSNRINEPMMPCQSMSVSTMWILFYALNFTHTYCRFMSTCETTRNVRRRNWSLFSPGTTPFFLLSLHNSV